MNPKRVLAVTFASVLSCLSANAKVVINEIFYHAPDDTEGLEYVELHNASDQPVDLSGWKFTKGIKFVFPAGAKVEPRGYVVLCRNQERLREFFGAEALGSFNKSLKNEGERIELANAQGEKVDSVKFNNKAPWPIAPDGFSPSLERISPSASSTIPQNWASSALPEQERKPTGTPGKRNDSFSDNLPPIISNVRFYPKKPGTTPPTPVEKLNKSIKDELEESKGRVSAVYSWGKGEAPPFRHPSPEEPVVVEAKVEDSDGVGAVKVRYRTAGPGVEKEETTLEMLKSAEGQYFAAIPAQSANEIVRFRIEAADAKGSKRFYPAETEPRPALSYLVYEPAQRSQISLATLIHVDPDELKASQQQGGGQGRQFTEEDQMRWMVWQQLRSGIDLASGWFDLVLNQQLEFDKVRKLQPVFARKKTEFDKLADSASQLRGIREKAKEVPKLVATFHTELREAVKPMLADEQFKKFTAWQETKIPKDPNQGMQWTPERMLQQMANLELAFFAATVQSDLNETQLAKLKTAYQNAVKERAKFAEAANSAMRGQGDWNKVHEDVRAVDEKVTKEVSAVLTRDQRNRFAQGRDEMPPFAFGRGGNDSKPVRGQSALVYIDPGTNQPQLFDFVMIRPRKAGFNVDLHDDQSLNGMTGLNLVFEYKDRFVLAEHLAYELYRRAGCPAPKSEFVRLSMDGRPLGYHLLIEQPNRAFLERNKIKPGGDMYKLLWFGRDIISKHEKKNNPETGHDDLIKLIETLENTQGDEQWAVIKKNFNVERVINYFAVNAALTHWDGFFNNYFTYHDTKGTGKWEMYPWDQDKTWGYHDSLRDDQIFWDMPIKYAHTGDEPRRPGGQRVQGFNVGHWWRPPGYFSGPLLANPHFRKHYVARTKEILETIYTPEIFVPLIDDLGKRLKEEVVIRANTIKESPETASQRLETNLQLLKDHLTKRREFLLKEEEIQMAGKFSRAALN